MRTGHDRTRIHRRRPMIGLVAVAVAAATIGLASPQPAGAAEGHPCTDAAVTRGEAAYQMEFRHQPSLVRLYCAAFFRPPDAEGFGYWDTQWSSHVSISEQAEYFVVSQEFVQRFGADLDPEAFLTVLYDHVFLRPPDPEGLAYWVELMSGPLALSRGRVLVEFAESAEMRNQVVLPDGLPRRERAFLVRNNPWGAGIMLGIDQEIPGNKPPLTQLPGSGVYINSIIAPYWQQLASAARADGYVIRVGPGGGYRSYEAQIEARKRNGCPDIFYAPSDQCAIPTSRPGESNHQSGLALDLDLGGSTAGSLTWLRNHAHDYGFYAFFSRNKTWAEMNEAERDRTRQEPWHWSIDGR